MLVSLKSKPPRIPDHDPGPLAPVLDWVDPRFGPILQVFGTQAAAPEPRWWLYNCTLARPLGEYFIDFDQIAMGSSISGSQALRRALGEAIERYNCASSFQFAETRFAPLQDNPMASLFPTCAEFESCLDSLKRLPLDKEITQVRMKTLAEDHEVWVPAGFVHLTFVRKKSEPMVATSITSGLAFHDDLTKAIWGGLMEYAERDAIMSVWWNRIESPRILINSQVEDVGLSERFRRLQSANSEAILFDVTSDFRIPTVFCILKSKSPPYVTVGGACNDDPILACSKALE